MKNNRRMPLKRSRIPVGFPCLLLVLFLGSIAGVTEIIIDNDAPETAFTGSWPKSTATDAYDPDETGTPSRWSCNGSTYTWTFTPLITGVYELSMWWSSHASRSSAVPLSIEYLMGRERVSIDQQVNGGRWNRIGVYPFAGGERYDVTLIAAPGEAQNYSTCADAVRFRFAGFTDTAPVAKIERIDPPAAEPNQCIRFQGSSIDTGNVPTAYEWRSDLDGIISRQSAFDIDSLSSGVHTIFFRIRNDKGGWSNPATALLVVRDCSRPVPIMPLGDSITYGVGEIRDANLSTGYRAPLYRSLRRAGYDVDFVGEKNTGGHVSPPFDVQHQGLPGIKDEEAAAGIYDWLTAHPAEIVLLHIGTNSLTANEGDVERIFDEIDRYEFDNDTDLIVVAARIINRKTYHPDTTVFNNNVQRMAASRIIAGDKIVLVDQEGALDYAVDMWDDLHPTNIGYAKMADVWMKALVRLLPACNRFPPEAFTTGNAVSETVGIDGLPATEGIGSCVDPPPADASNRTSINRAPAKGDASAF